MLTLILSHLKLVLGFLFYKLQEPDLSNIGEENVECAVCLCKIGEGEVLKVLRCEHAFHEDCIDKWISIKNSTCPLCRESVSEVGAQVLLFEFCSVHAKNDDGDSWWLR
ncbi:unnamed protein product [Lathyrus sativus]|nr:unnamed protein product [Lathyrus sativus]